MNSQVCVNCFNEKAVNSTDNRLVTEKCGHIKCMDCLLHEKNGCSACLREKNGEELDTSAGDSGDSGSERKEVNESLIKGYDSDKKTKPDIAHIRIETDAIGRCFFCTVCKKKFHARSHVAYHAYCNGQRKPYQCPECSKSFATQSHFKYHMRVHRNERGYSCDVCGESFFQMSRLQRHMLQHTKEKKYACIQCENSFTSMSSLRKHELTHTEQRPFVCSVCSRRFRDSSNYKKHMDKHEEGKKCTCGRGCSLCLASGVVVERRAHVCPRCPRAFHSRKDMRRHQAVHTDSKPYRCKVCNRRFRRKDNLDRHIRNTHPDCVPAAAADCDVSALRDVTARRGDPAPPSTPAPGADKTMLKVMNPLPPLPQEVIQEIRNTHPDCDVTAVQDRANGHDGPASPSLIRTSDKAVLKIMNPLSTVPQETLQKQISESSDANKRDGGSRSVIEKSYILEANNQRQSVIVGKCTFEKKAPSPPGKEYVHKIRKANSMASQRNIPLPPIDEKKMMELEQKDSQNNFDIGAPPKDVELYKKILYEKSEIDGRAHEDDVKKASVSPEMHWRRKMKLINSNW